MIRPSQIYELETLRAATEDDLRKAGLKMGDIIKIRMLLAKQDLESSVASTSSKSSEDSERSFSMISPEDNRNRGSGKTSSGAIKNTVTFSRLNVFVAACVYLPSFKSSYLHGKVRYFDIINCIALSFSLKLVSFI